MKNREINVKWLRKGQVLVDRLTGKKMVVTDVNADGFTVCEKDKENELGYLPETLCQVSEKEIVTYGFCYDPNPETPNVADFAVRNGLLIKADEAFTEQGAIRIRSIIGAVPNYLILNVVPKDGDGADVFSYDITKDKFKKIVSVPVAELIVLRQFEDGGYILGYNGSDMVDVPDDDGVITQKELFIGAGTVYVSSKAAGSVRTFDGNLLLDDVTVLDNDIYIGTNKSAIEDEDSESIYLEDDDYSYYNATTGVVELVTKAPASIKRSPLYGDTIKTSDSITVCGVTYEVGAEKIKEFDGYDTVVSVEYNDDAHLTRITFSNASRRIKRLSVKNTSDRGTIYFVE